MIPSRAMKLAGRMQRIGESATLRVSRQAAELRRRGVDVIDFGVGEPDFPSPPVAVEAARAALADGFTKYTDGSGIRELRQAVAGTLAERYGAPWPWQQVVITIGAKMALFELALALYEPGDEVVIPTPCWVSFPEQVRFAGAEAVAVPTSGEDGFRIHAGPIIEAFTGRTRAVILNSPSNPSGGVIAAADLRRLAEACAERGVVLIADETYDRFLYDGATHASAAALAAEMPQTVVLVGSFSKTYSMTGWRLGYLCGPPELVRAVAAVQSHSTSNPVSFAMRGAVAAAGGAEADVEAMIAAFQARRDLLIAGFDALPGFSCLPPAGAFYAFPDVSGLFRDGRRGSVAVAEWLLTVAGVAVVPGVAFGSDEHVRISFACSEETLRQGLERIGNALAKDG